MMTAATDLAPFKRPTTLVFAFASFCPMIYLFQLHHPLLNYFQIQSLNFVEFSRYVLSDSAYVWVEIL